MCATRSFAGEDESGSPLLAGEELALRSGATPTNTLDSISGGWRGDTRQAEVETRALPQTTLDPDVAAHRLHILAAEPEGQPFPGDGRHQRLRQPHELLEELCLILDGDARAVVLDRHHHPFLRVVARGKLPALRREAGARGNSPRDAARLAWPCVLDGVADEI